LIFFLPHSFSFSVQGFKRDTFLFSIVSTAPVSIKALLFLDLMAKACNGGNLTRNDTCKREAPIRTKFTDLQREAQQALCDIQAALARLAMNPNVNRNNNRIRNNDGTLVQPVSECVHMLPNRQPTY
jgi:hypothetical protein